MAAILADTAPSGALPQLMERAPQARLYISQRATGMLKGSLKPRDEAFAYTTVGTGDRVSLGDRSLRFLHTPFLHWSDTQCTYLEEQQVLFSGDVFGCHFCDSRLFNDRVGDFRFSFDYYYAHIMRPFEQHVPDPELVWWRPLATSSRCIPSRTRRKGNFVVQRTQLGAVRCAKMGRCDDRNTALQPYAKALSIVPLQRYDRRAPCPRAQSSIPISASTATASTRAMATRFPCLSTASTI